MKTNPFPRSPRTPTQACLPPPCATLRIALPLALALLTSMGLGAELRWQQLSSKRGDLPVPGESQQQTGAVVADFDQDGVNDFILSFRQKPPALVWYRRTASSWERLVIEKGYLTVEAGGAVCDIDGDGDLDVVFGGDWQSSAVWWWENPFPKFDPTTSWNRHRIKSDGARQHHDQVFADLTRSGRPQLAFWNQGAKKIFLAAIPSNPREAPPWPLTPIFSGSVEGKLPYAEGLSAADIDGDGQIDLLAGNYWFKHTGGAAFNAITIGSPGGLIFAGQLIEGGFPEVVISAGDGTGPLKWYQCKGQPDAPKSWSGHDLAGRTVIHGHSLQLGDIDRDGHLDVFAAEMAKWSNQSAPDHPTATAWIFFGDGKGNFRKTELVVGHGWHEARLADLDGDGDLDLLNKPYTWDTPRVDVWLNNGTGPRQAGR